jgi:hypothetical protein
VSAGAYAYLSTAVITHHVRLGLLSVRCLPSATPSSDKKFWAFTWVEQTSPSLIFDSGMRANTQVRTWQLSKYIHSIRIKLQYLETLAVAVMPRIADSSMDAYPALATCIRQRIFCSISYS